jgi:hypothetical protein
MACLAVSHAFWVHRRGTAARLGKVRLSARLSIVANLEIAERASSWVSAAQPNKAQTRAHTCLQEHCTKGQ